MGLTQFIVTFAITFITSTKYVGIFVLMACESMILPVPSEAVMPFAGFAVFSKTLTFFGIIVASTLGSITGSLISYWIGRYGGRAFVKRWGKYLLLDEHDLDVTERFFNRNGEKTIFISRFIPVIRHLISIPAGVGRMRLGKFILYTTVGAALWNAFLGYLGFVLGSHWERIKQFGEVIDIIIVVLLLAFLAYLIIRAKRRKRAAQEQQTGKTNTPNSAP